MGEEMVKIIGQQLVERFSVQSAIESSSALTLHGYKRLDRGWIKMLSIIMVIFSISGCKSPSSPPVTDSSGIIPITIDPIKDKISFPLSVIAEKVDAIELEITDSSLIKGEIRQVDILDNHYIVEDGSIGVLVFDKQGNFVRRIGRLGQGPGDLYQIERHNINQEKGVIWFWLRTKFVVFDINGHLIEDKSIDKRSGYDYNYYYNDTIFYFQDIQEMKEGLYYQDLSFNIYAYSNGKYSDNLLDSVLVWKREKEPGFAGPYKTIFQHKGQVFMFLALSGYENCFLYTYKENQFVPVARFMLDRASPMRGLTFTDRYVAAIHGPLIWDTRSPNIITPEISRALRDQGGPVQDYSYYVYDYKTGKSINSYHGFIDDIHHTNDTIRIKFIDGGEKFFYTRENDFSEALRTEPNPTLYIGTFRK